MHSVLFSALSTRYTQCKALAVRTRNCRLLCRGWLLAQMSSARSRIKRCRNDSWAGSHVVPRLLHWILTEEVEKIEKCQILWVHTYHTTSSRRKGRRVQSLVEIGSEMWICINKETDKNEQKTISSLYIRLKFYTIKNPYNGHIKNVY